MFQKEKKKFGMSHRVGSENPDFFFKILNDILSISVVKRKKKKKKFLI